MDNLQLLVHWFQTPSSELLWINWIEMQSLFLDFCDNLGEKVDFVEGGNVKSVIK